MSLLLQFKLFLCTKVASHVVFLHRHLFKKWYKWLMNFFVVYSFSSKFIITDYQTDKLLLLLQ